MVALLSALALPSAAHARRTLHPGDHNPAVRVLQRALGLHADGIFGAGTERAVKRFQRGHQLHADGVVGAATWRALVRRGSSARVTSHGGAVRLLQRRLGIPTDGIFGPGTRRALKRFQRAHGLTADGIAGPATWRALGIRGRHAVLKARHATRRVPHRPHRRKGSAVRLLQRRLGIAADGIFGPGTRRALRRFQRAHGLTADGVAGPATWSALGLRGQHPLLRSHGGGARVVRGGAFSRIARGIAAANRIARLPYRYGGGHRSFHDSGYDCSGSVSYVLHAMGVLSSPEDSSQLMSYGAPGPGRWVTIYANPGHAYMTIRGRRFDTSAQWQGGSRWSLLDRSGAGYTVRHPPGL